jgi:hypothetical protein
MKLSWRLASAANLAEDCAIRAKSLATSSAVLPVLISGLLAF